MYQYFVKVVPTVYKKLSGDVRITVLCIIIVTDFYLSALTVATYFSINPHNSHMYMYFCNLAFACTHTVHNAILLKVFPCTYSYYNTCMYTHMHCCVV